MSWALAFLLAVIAFCASAFLLKAPRPGWEAIGAALLLGIAGYGLQASPGLPGAPKASSQKVASDPGALVEARRDLAGEGSSLGSNWVVMADGMARNGQYANAATLLLGAVEENPNDAEAWLALANALVSHAEGMLTPASMYAFRHAAEAQPDHPGPPFFLGLALAQSGRLGDARALWADLLENSPADAPWRADLEARLARLDEFIASQEMPQAPR
ncbi:MAG: tetratricopeptide repeat protein [Novosphingobium sp.]|nr:tetratricopeptide repeat protein [Novosphingobium sp.]MCP5400799.1 tetratricopeptide repeat protein [Novosphingobium sp.]